MPIFSVNREPLLVCPMRLYFRKPLLKVNGERQIFFRDHLNFVTNHTCDFCQLKGNFGLLANKWLNQAQEDAAQLCFQSGPVATGGTAAKM